MLRTTQSLPPTGLSTLGFDPTRYQTEPPACYRASWQLPGRDSHPLATTSLSSDQVTPSTTSETLGTRRSSRTRRRLRSTPAALVPPSSAGAETCGFPITKPNSATFVPDCRGCGGGTTKDTRLACLFRSVPSSSTPSMKSAMRLPSSPTSSRTYLANPCGRPPGLPETPFGKGRPTGRTAVSSLF